MRGDVEVSGNAVDEHNPAHHAPLMPPRAQLHVAFRDGLGVVCVVHLGGVITR